MRRVSSGEPILPHITADWYNSTLPKTGARNKDNHLPPEKAPLMAVIGSATIFNPVAILEAYNTTYPPVARCSSSGITPFNWGVALENGDNSGLKVATQGITLANVTGDGTYVTYDGTKLVGGPSGKALLLKYNGPTDASVIFLGHSSPTGWVLETPPLGIPGKDGYTVSSRNCEIILISSSTLVRTGIDVPVTNIFTGDIEGDILITAKLVDNKLVVDAEDCDGEPLPLGSGGSSSAS